MTPLEFLTLLWREKPEHLYVLIWTWPDRRSADRGPDLGSRHDPKRAYERALNSGELEVFDFILAEALHMTIEEMRNRMSNQEWVQWAAFYSWRDRQRELAMRMATSGR